MPACSPEKCKPQTRLSPTLSIRECEVNRDTQAVKQTVGEGADAGAPPGAGQNDRLVHARRDGARGQERGGLLAAVTAAWVVEVTAAA